jgi:hypothetical protein
MLVKGLAGKVATSTGIRASAGARLGRALLQRSHVVHREDNLRRDASWCWPTRGGKPGREGAGTRRECSNSPQHLGNAANVSVAVGGVRKGAPASTQSGARERVSTSVLSHSL